MKTVEIKLMCKQANIDKIDAGAKGILISFRNNVFAEPEKLLDLIKRSFGVIKVRPDQRLFIERNLESYAVRVETIKNFGRPFGRFVEKIRMPLKKAPLLRSFRAVRLIVLF